MEMLGYNLFHWCSGSIPWDGYHDDKRIEQSKSAFRTDLESMRGLLPYKQMGMNIYAII